MSWYEHCTKDEIPPEYLWEDQEGLDQWWETVKEKRDAKYGIAPDSTSGSSSNEDGEADQGPGSAENDYARALKSGR